MALSFKTPDPAGECCGCRADPCANCCVSVAVQWDSVSGSKTAPSCYFDPFVANPEIKYKKKVTITSVNNSTVADKNDHILPQPPNADSHAGFTNSEVSTKTETADYSGEDGCATPVVCDGPAQGTYDCTWVSSNENPDESGDSHFAINSCTGARTCTGSSHVNCSCIETFTLQGCPTTGYTSLDQADTETVRIRGNERYRTCYRKDDIWNADPGSYVEWSGQINEYTLTTSTLSEAYTKADLESELLAALPAFDDDWNDTAGSFKNVSGWSESVRRARYHFVHEASPTGYLRVEIEEIFQPEGGGAPTVTPLAPYVWTGSPSAGTIISAPFDFNEPSADGEKTLNITLVTCQEE